MSKIFEAIQKGSGGASEILPALLQDQPAPESANSSSAVAVDEPEARAAASAPPQPEAAPAKAAPEIRVMPIRVKSDSPVLIFDQPKSRAGEQYRILRTKIIHHPAHPQIILVSSPGPGDGKTVTAINFAGALSLKLDAKILLLDTDFRRSRVHKELGLPLGPGLTDVLDGQATLEEALVQIAQYSNLHVMTAGDVRNNPAELLDSATWRELLTRLRQEFEYIVLDSPPIAAVADYHLLQTAADGVMTVMRPDHTKRSMAKETLESIPPEKNLGVILNCVENWFLSPSKPAYYYYGEADGK